MCFKRKIKEINPNLNISSKEIVVYQKFKKDRIPLGIPIKIPRNFAYAICVDNKVLDVLYEEVARLELKALPETMKKLGLYKVDKKQRPPKYFKADTYFINQNVFEDFPWETSEYAELEDKAYGLYKTSCFGKLSFRIINPEELLHYLFKTTNIFSEISAEKMIKSYINERIVRILNKENPPAKELYLKDKKIIKLIYNKLSDLLLEIGISLEEISLTETRFPPKVISDLKENAEKPLDFSGWGKTFEEWQISNPPPTNKRARYVTIIPTGEKTHFFEESMAPYFFDEDEVLEEVENKVEEVKVQKVWKGIDEKAKEEQEKKIVDLDDNDDR